MRIAVLGSGYVGLVCGACFADLGHFVTCADTDRGKIERLKAGRIPIFEPGLDPLIAENSKTGRLSFTTDLTAAIRSADIVFLTVGTPPGPSGGADLTCAYQCARTIATHMQGFTIIVTKSTVPLGTGEELEAIVRTERPDGDFSIVSNPEFLREGAAIHDFKHPDRIVIGVEDDRARQVMAELYRPLQEGNVPILFTTRRTAELIKYAANSFLATKIAFMGEIADLCESSGADVQEVALGIGLDQRIGPKFLQAGPGYGGSCFSKDALALVETGRQLRTPLRIVETVIEVNEARKHSMVDKIVESCGGTVRNKRLAVLGLTFKPNTDDVREAPSLTIVPALQARGARVCVYDPAGMTQAGKFLPGLLTAKNPYACVRRADAIVILTEWDLFKRLDLDRIKRSVRRAVMIDLRNIFQPADMWRRGFDYFCIGRPHQDRDNLSPSESASMAVAHAAVLPGRRRGAERKPEYSNRSASLPDRTHIKDLGRGLDNSTNGSKTRRAPWNSVLRAVHRHVPKILRGRFAVDPRDRGLGSSCCPDRLAQTSGFG